MFNCCSVPISMEFIKTPPSKCEVKSIIKFLTAKKCSAAKIYRRLWAVYGKNNVMVERNVDWWEKMFPDGKTSAHDEDWTGRPPTTINGTAWCVSAFLDKDSCFTWLNFHQDMVTRFRHESCGMIHEVLTNKLQMKKVCTQWVPKKLSLEHQWNLQWRWQCFLGNNSNRYINVCSGTLFGQSCQNHRRESMVNFKKLTGLGSISTKTVPVPPIANQRKNTTKPGRVKLC